MVTTGCERRWLMLLGVNSSTSSPPPHPRIRASDAASAAGARHQC